MPHTCIQQYIGIEHTNCTYTRNRCCPLSFYSLKIATFSNKDCENTFYVCYKPIKGIIARTNLENISQKTNTYGAKLHQTLLKNKIETKLCYLQLGEIRSIL